MKGFPKTLKTKADYYNCFAMVADGSLSAADLLAKINSVDFQRYIQCPVISMSAKTVTIHFCNEAVEGMKFLVEVGEEEITGKITSVIHNKTKPEDEGTNDVTILTLSQAIPLDTRVIALEVSDTAAGMSVADIASLKEALKRYE